jgi:hypothetical protein
MEKVLAYVPHYKILKHVDSTAPAVHDDMDEKKR